MMPIQAYLVTTHLDDLRRDAAAARLARQVELGDDGGFGDPAARPPRRSDVRRTVARAILQLSVAADAAARRVDPCLHETFGTRGATRAIGSAGR